LRFQLGVCEDSDLLRRDAQSLVTDPRRFEGTAFLRHAGEH